MIEALFQHGQHMYQIPLNEVLAMQRITFDVMHRALSGDQEARQEIEQVAAVATDPYVDEKAKCHAVVSVFLLGDAFDQLAMLHAKQIDAEKQSALVTEGVSVPDVAVAGKCEHDSDAVCQYCVKG